MDFRRLDDWAVMGDWTEGPDSNRDPCVKLGWAVIWCGEPAAICMCKMGLRAIQVVDLVKKISFV